MSVIEVINTIKSNDEETTIVDNVGEYESLIMRTKKRHSNINIIHLNIRSLQKISTNY